MFHILDAGDEYRGMVFVCKDNHLGQRERFYWKETGKGEPSGKERRVINLPDDPPVVVRI